jgi:hypothetical protein
MKMRESILLVCEVDLHSVSSPFSPFFFFLSLLPLSLSSSFQGLAKSDFLQRDIPTGEKKLLRNEKSGTRDPIQVIN